MKQIFTLIALIFAAILTSHDVYAQEVRSDSAKLDPVISVQKDYSLDTRTVAVRNVFKRYNSPLVDQAAFYVKYADEFGVDWKLLPAISGLESTFGRFLMPGSYNAYGWGATDVWSIGPIYAESPTWSVRVNRFMQEIEAEYQSLSTFKMALNI